MEIYKTNNIMDIDVSKSIIGSVIYYCNCKMALDEKLVTCFEIMDYLVENRDKIPYHRLLYCFYCVVSSFPSEYQYVQNKHFTYYFRDDTLMMKLYCFIVKNLEYPIDKNDNTILLWQYMCEAFFDLVDVEHVENRILFCLMNMDYSLKEWSNIPSKEEWLIECIFLFNATKYQRLCFEHYTEKEMVKKIIEYYIKTDNINELSDKEIISCIDIYSEFVYKIKTKCPLYFEKMKSYYMRGLHKMPISKLEKLEISQIKNLLKISSNGYMRSLNIKDEYYRLCIYPIQTLSYILGFHIEKEIPTFEEIQQKIELLEKLGPEEFCKLEKYKNNDNVANDMDSLCEDPNDYLIFDRYDLKQNGKLYQFTRPEFQQLVEKNENFYTKCELPVNMFITIEMRSKFSSLLGLPNSDTHYNLIKKGIDGKLYEMDKKKKEEQEREINQITQSNPFTQMILSLMNSQLQQSLN